MTPPDSGELRHECRCGRRITTRNAEGAHTWSKCKPDSGEREVECNAAINSRTGNFEHFECEMPLGHYGPHKAGDAEWTDETTRYLDGVTLPLLLAQRILAALESKIPRRDCLGVDLDGFRALAAELRVRLPK